PGAGGFWTPGAAGRGTPGTGGFWTPGAVWLDTGGGPLGCAAEGGATTGAAGGGAGLAVAFS
ncbi:MAG TPA: hypothetical protein PLR66_09525, partial [Planctomycetota bacterium]|nr:hypothetical protein [Planctomycetota bacterium]